MYKSYLAVFSENVFQVSSISSYCQTSNKQVVTRISVFVITTANIKGKIFFFKKKYKIRLYYIGSLERERLLYLCPLCSRPGERDLERLLERLPLSSDTR